MGSGRDKRKKAKPKAAGHGDEKTAAKTERNAAKGERRAAKKVEMMYHDCPALVPRMLFAMVSRMTMQFGVVPGR